VGRVDIGEVSVAIAVAAPHRATAMEACRFVIDTPQGGGAHLEAGAFRRRRGLGRVRDSNRFP